MASPMRGSCRRKATDEVGAVAQMRCLHLIRHGFAVPPSPHRGRLLVLKNQKNAPQKGADQQIRPAPSIDGRCSTETSCKFGTPVSGGAYQDARKVSLVWNAKLKHCFPPEFRGRMHQTRPSTLFSPIFSLAREKIGPPEARQKRPRRNESLQARLLILCARFFLSKPQTEFAVWVLSQICDNLSVSLRLTASLPLLSLRDISP